LSANLRRLLLPLDHSFSTSSLDSELSTASFDHYQSINMGILSAVATGLMAALHAYILVLEMFLWNTPRGRKAFKLTADFAEKTKALAANQGLYNGFLAAGLVWGLIHEDPAFAAQIRLFFLGCIVVAGLFGAATASTRILYIQALPAAASILAVLYG
jgi:putative membrane protein